MRLNAKEVIEVIKKSRHPELKSIMPERFSEGELVKVRRNVLPLHTRVPGYIRGCTGTVVKVHGIYVFADTRAHQQGDCPQPLYCVRFDKNELWGAGGEGNNYLYIDLYDSYLDEVM